MKISVFIATSLDGFIAREDDSLDWLDAANATVPKGEDCGFKRFFDSVDVLVMGRKSFEKVLTFGTWFYGEKNVIVLSSRPLQIPEHLKNVSHASLTPEALVKEISSKGMRHIYVDGGETIRRFLRAGLVHEMTITTIPVLLGSGKPLFGELEKDIQLELIASKAYDFGFVSNTYRVKDSKKKSTKNT